ncbi:Hypothetical protein D9617_11g009640 [Elsinoe fawcettii]|nr:Hypothetical protein D9617_11g009640 [Elsinoe fawcettii]
MQPFQGNHAQGQRYSQPPPIKKIKTAGGAVITKYAPPPGYVPPTPPMPGFMPAPMPAPAWPPQPYYTPEQQAYMSQYYQHYAQQYTQQYDQPHQGYSRADYAPINNGWPQQNGFNQAPTAAPPPPQQQLANPQGYAGYPNFGHQWPAQGGFNDPVTASSPAVPPHHPVASQASATPAAPAPPIQIQSATLSPTTSNATQPSDNDDEGDLGDPFVEENYYRQASYAKGDPPPKDLDIGTAGITCHAPLFKLAANFLTVCVTARPVKKPLPSTWQEAELELVAPKTDERENDLISQYFAKSKQYEVELSVRQLDEWNEVKDDLIFKEFPKPDAAEYIPIDEVKKNRQRPDPASREQPTEQPVQQTTSPIPEMEYEADEVEEAIARQVESEGEDDAAMDLSSDDEEQSDEPSEKAFETKGDELEVKPADVTGDKQPSVTMKQDVYAHVTRNGQPCATAQESIEPVSKSFDYSGGYRRGSGDDRAASGSPWSLPNSAQNTPPSYQDQYSRQGFRRVGSGQRNYSTPDLHQETYPPTEFHSSRPGQHSKVPGKYSNSTPPMYQGSQGFHSSRGSTQVLNDIPPQPSNSSGRNGHGEYTRGPTNRYFENDEYRRRPARRKMYGPNNPPPPPAPFDFENPWRNSDPASWERRASNGSNTSQRTVPGGDFENADRDRTPQNKPHNRQKGGDRKRSYDEVDRSDWNRGSRQTDNQYPRSRPNKQHVPEAYGPR